MASLRNKLPEPKDVGALDARLCDSVLRSLSQFATGSKSRICVGYSGGLDSTVLLHVLSEARRSAAFELSALHVHHGLSSNAATWVRHCRAVCRELNVPFRLRRVAVVRAAQTSLEEEARRARYAAMSSTRADVIALAHHADDQAETVLLQLLRGAGPKGLSGMAPLKVLGFGVNQRLPVWRPLLGCTRAELLRYAVNKGLGWIGDESNLDVRFKRNFIRREVMPVLARGFPATVETLARAARHLAESTELVEMLADMDLARARLASGLDVAVLKAMADVRLKNVLRRWLDLQHLRQPSEARLLALLRALRQSSNDTRLAWEHDGRTVQRSKGLLHCT